MLYVRYRVGAAVVEISTSWSSRPATIARIAGSKALRKGCLMVI
jgi:hypothetical protein